MIRDHTGVPAFVRKTKAKPICKVCWDGPGHDYIILNKAGQCWLCSPELNRRRHAYVPNKEIEHER